LFELVRAWPNYIANDSRRFMNMPDAANLVALDNRIAVIRENIRELVEQAAASSGAAGESLSADRIAAYEAQLAAAIKERESLG
jgi:hypothetical protein